MADNINNLSNDEKVRLLYKLGETFLTGLQFDKAKLKFEEAINCVDADSPLASLSHSGLGRVYFLMAEIEKDAVEKERNRELALSEFCKALELDQENNDALYFRGQIYSERGKVDEALEDITKLVKSNFLVRPEAKKLYSDLLTKKANKITNAIDLGKKKSTYQEYKEKLDAIKFEAEDYKPIKSELDSLNNTFELNGKEIPADAANYYRAKSFLDMVLRLPWAEPAPEELDFDQAIEILEKEHYGLKEVKERIFEFLARRKMRNDTKGAVVCLVGPPGVGKTSIAKSIARAIGRLKESEGKKGFYRFSVGGMSDESQLRGHNRAYVGANPGQLVKALEITGTKAPVILIDEIDKIGSRNWGGDPYSALLEVLDPEQNNKFRDRYLEVPLDLSNVFFICTANDDSPIPAPLRDRMEMITIPGYLDDEKLQIAKQYLLPRSFENNGLKLGQIEYTEAALLKVATEYEKEPGVRMLQQNLDKVHRKIVYQLVRENGKSAAGGTEPEKFLLDAPDIERYLGKPRHSEKGLNVQKPDRPGVAIGLCVTGGTLGATLMIETIAIPGEEGVNITGHMAELMKESAEVALAFAKKLAIEQYGVAPDFFKKNHIHIHVPTANPKDGNSAGITIAAALLSLFINKTITGTLVMTGEITLTGKVLAIGGLKEKLLGAKRNKAEHIIFPKENLPDWEEIPPEIREGITPHPVERFEEVLWDRYLSTVKIADPSAIDELAE